jgi:hypothetical protein
MMGWIMTVCLEMVKVEFVGTVTQLSVHVISTISQYWKLGDVE